MAEIYKQKAVAVHDHRILGQILAQGKGTRIAADFDGHVLMAPKEKKTTFLKEEVLFLSRPVKKLTI